MAATQAHIEYCEISGYNFTEQSVLFIDSDSNISFSVLPIFLLRANRSGPTRIVAAGVFRSKSQVGCCCDLPAQRFDELPYFG